MAVRIRKLSNGIHIIICAAKSDERLGDIYIGDALHYTLGVELRVMSTYGTTPGGADLWEFHNPMFMEDKIKKETENQDRIWKTSGDEDLSKHDTTKPIEAAKEGE